MTNDWGRICIAMEEYNSQIFELKYADKEAVFEHFRNISCSFTVHRIVLLERFVIFNF